jgi:GH15 family glucan-1,4-alpha-glucosidase
VNEFYRAIEGKPPELYTSETIRYWRNWTSNRAVGQAGGLADDISQTVRDVYERSLFVLQDCQAANGSIIASPDSRTLKLGGDSYCYCWWRDGAIITRALSELDLDRNTVAFLRFAAKAQENEGYFLHRHFPDGSVGSTWHPPPFLQVDQTASVIDATRYFYEFSGIVYELLPPCSLLRDAADFPMAFVDGHGLPRPSYDLWEENKSVNTYTVATAIQGLRGAADIGEALGKRSDFWREASERMHKVALDELWNPDKGAFYKSIDPKDDALDASVLLALQTGLLPPSHDRYAAIVDAIEDRLWVKDVGGLARYEGDTYYGHENPWIICTLWLARCRLALGDLDRCRELIEWAASKAGPTDLLAEQLDRQTGEPTSVTPLVWSHSTFIETVNAYTRALAGQRTPQQERRTAP